MNNSHNGNLFSNNNSSFNVTNSNNTTYNHNTVSDEELRILSWISPLESWKRHSDVVRTRVRGIGEWVIQSDEFQAWRRGGNDRTGGRILFCHGAPGAGKTFICSLVIDTLCDEAGGLSVAVGCLYCDYGGQKEQAVDAMIGSLLRQFVTGLPHIPGVVTEAFQAAKAHLGRRALELAKIVELFQAVLGQFQKVFICVDALDEFVVDYRARFLCSLRQISDQSPNTRLFLTARSHIRSELESHVPLHMSTITVRPLFSDIANYLIARLDTDPYPGAMDDGLRSEIMTKVPRGASGVFLLVKLQMDSILGEITRGGRRKKLPEATTGLSNAYTATLDRIKGQQSGVLVKTAISALMWISLAERPLLIDELCHALAMEVGSPNIDTEMVPRIETVVASCMGLVTTDHASSRVRLVHATLKEYLRGHQDTVFQNGHATIAEICLSYLSIQSVRELPSDLATAPPEFPLLRYASCYWGAHARKELTASVSQFALGILDQYPQHVAANIFLSNGGAPWSLFYCDSKGFSGLHYVSHFGIDGLVEAMVSTKRVNLNRADMCGRTPLILAAGRGNEGVVRILMRQAGINPNSARWDGGTPLLKASANGHEGIVRILLSYIGINPDSPDQDGRTPLHLASAKGHEAVVTMLLSYIGINPDSTDTAGKTPLHEACSNGHEGIARILLSRADLNPNSADRDGQTPLHQASAKGHEGTVKMLLSYTGINPDPADEAGRTPLFMASVNGHEGIVRMLLSRADVNPSSAGWGGRALLHHASANGHEGIMRMLLSSPHADPNSSCWGGRTPLHQASSNGHEGIVRMLLSRADINPNSAGWRGETPLHQACANDHEGVVRLLLSSTDVNPNPTDWGDRTPLHQASAKGHEVVVRMLLSFIGLNPDSADEAGRTPLFEASSNRHEGIVRMLLSRTDVKPNIASWGGQTPLHEASAKGYEGIVRMLLNRADINPNSSSWDGGTPLHEASAKGYEGIVRMLLSRADVNPNSAGRDGRTPLLQASANGHEGVVRMLLSRADVNPNSATLRGGTPLFQASANGHERVVRMLLSRTDVGPNPAYQDG